MKRQDYKKMMQQKKAIKSFTKTALLGALSIGMFSMATQVNAAEEVGTTETDNGLVFEEDASMAPNNDVVFEEDTSMAPDNGLVFEEGASMAPDNGLVFEEDAPMAPDNGLVSTVVTDTNQTIVTSTATTGSEFPQTGEETAKLATSLIGLGLLGSSAIMMRRRSINTK